MKFPHNTDTGLAFYNDKVMEVMDAGIMAEPFTYIPIKAGHMELVGGNAIVFGDMTEGENAITPDITTTISYQDVSSGNTVINLSVLPYLTNYQLVKVSGLGDAIAFLRQYTGVIVVQIPSIVYATYWYYITVINPVEGINLTVSYQAKITDAASDVAAGLKLSLQSLMANPGRDISSGPDANSLYIYPRTNSYEDAPNWEPGDINTVYEWFTTLNAYALLSGYVNIYPDLKCGASHSFGIVYKDRAGRQSSVMEIDAVYIPFYTENVNNLLESIVILQFFINNSPPDWAETYEIVYFGNSTMDNFLQIRENNITKLTLGTYRYSLNIVDTINWTYKQNNRWTVSPWTWQAGDRIRLIGTMNTVTGVVTKYTTLYDYEIEATTDQYDATAGNWLIFQAKNHPTDLDLGTSAITNLTGNLNGGVITTVANAPTVARVDQITLTGNSGTATVRVGLLGLIATWHTSLDQTATDFVNANQAAYSAIGIDLVKNGVGVLQFTAHVAGVDFPFPSNVLVEVYRPKKGLGQLIAYGCGMVFDIATDSHGNRYHKGDVNQVFNAARVLVTPATVNNTANDCWKFDRLNYVYNSGSVQPFWAESVFPSDWWSRLDINTKLTSDGFPFVEDLSLRQMVLEERIRNGGFLLTGTQTNNIAHFTFDAFQDLPEKDGAIVGLREIGYTLKVLQEHKETSIYINRVQNFSADGESQFTLTNKFLGETRPMDDDYGCQHPDSIMVNNRSLYYWDNNEGAFIRSDANGQKILSNPEYKMSRWFKDLLRWIQTSGGSSLLQVRIGANNEHQEIWLTFRIGTDVKGIIFSEKKGRFITEINQITESYIHLGNFFGHLYQQTLWIMNIDEGQAWLSWVGVPTYAELEVVSNIEPSKNKVFTAIALFADHLLQSLSKFIHIPQEASGSGDLMESNVPIWDRREGVYFGEIMKDENSPGSFLSVLDAKLNGREMRGRYCFAKFHTEEHTEKVRVDSVVIMSTPSERNV